MTNKKKATNAHTMKCMYHTIAEQTEENVK